MYNLSFYSQIKIVIGGFEENRIDGSMYWQLIIDTTHNATDLNKHHVVSTTCSTHDSNGFHKRQVVHTTHTTKHYYRRRVNIPFCVYENQI